MEFGQVPLGAPQVNQAVEALFQGPRTHVASVLSSLVDGLLIQQKLHGLSRQRGRHRLQQSQREMIAAVREMASSEIRQAPAVDGAAGPLGRPAALHQAIHFQASEVTAHDLNGNIQGLGQISGRFLAIPEQDPQNGLACRGCGFQA